MRTESVKYGALSNWIPYMINPPSFMSYKLKNPFYLSHWVTTTIAFDCKNCNEMKKTKTYVCYQYWCRRLKLSQCVYHFGTLFN